MSSIRNITASSSVPDDLAKRLGPSGVNEFRLLTLEKWKHILHFLASTCTMPLFLSIPDTRVRAVHGR